MQNLYDWIGFALVTISILIAGVVGLRRSSHANGYLIADRSIGLFALVSTLVMTEFNTSTLLAFSGVGYRAGPMAVALPLVFLIGLLWYTFVVARKWKAFDRLSVAEFFGERYGKRLGKTASVLLITAMIGFSSTYVKSLCLIFLPSLNMQLSLSAVLTALVLAMTIQGGLVSVVRTDIVSFLLKLIFLPVLLWIGWAKWGGISALAKVLPSSQLGFHPIEQWNHPSLPFWFVSSLIVLTMFTYICSPWYGQKIFAAQDEKTAFVAVGIASILVFLLYASVVLAAAFFRMEDPALANPETVVPAMFSLWLPTFFRGMGFAVLFTAASTVMTGVWSAMVAMCAADFDSLAFLKSSVRYQRLLTVFFAFVSWAGANLLVDDILNRLILANIPIAALSFSLLAGFYWKRSNSTGAWVSVVVGVAWGVGCFIHWGEAGGYTWYWAIYGIPLIFITGILGSLLKPTDWQRELS